MIKFRRSWKVRYGRRDPQPPLRTRRSLQARTLPIGDCFAARLEDPISRCGRIPKIPTLMVSSRIFPPALHHQARVSLGPWYGRDRWDADRARPSPRARRAMSAILFRWCSICSAPEPPMSGRFQALRGVRGWCRWASASRFHNRARARSMAHDASLGGYVRSVTATRLRRVVGVRALHPRRYEDLTRSAT